MSRELKSTKMHQAPHKDAPRFYTCALPKKNRMSLVGFPVCHTIPVGFPVCTIPISAFWQSCGRQPAPNPPQSAESAVPFAVHAPL